MFEMTPTVRLVGEVRAYDFSADPVTSCGANRIDAIRELDRAIRAAQAEQTRQISALYVERCTVMRVAEGDPALSVIGEVGMARHIGPGAAGLQFALAIGMAQLPQVFELFLAGRISEATARAVVTETASLSVDDHPLADHELASNIVGLTTVQARHAAARIVISIDAEAAYVRAKENRADRRVSLHPEADGVATLIVRGPAEQMLAAYKTLDEWATGLRATGDPRTRGQIMCQTLVERVTGLKYADSPDVEVNLVMEDCKIRDGDHIREHRNGGLSVKENGQGLCKRSHTIRHQPGWTVRSRGNSTIWRTPTGHEYTSDPPPVLPRDNHGHLRQ